ncbi:MAG: hypothetical protein WKG07_32680 [Hymenobacter sp.]
MVSAGADNTIVLPTSSVTLPGSATDSDGTIVSRSWSQLSGPAGAVISTAATGTATMTGLVQGAYIFRFTATDNKGAASTDDVAITVNAVSSGGGADAGTAFTGPLLLTDNDQLNGSTLVPINATSADGWHKSQAALKFAANATGWVQFQLTDAPGSGSIILDPSAGIPFGPSYGNLHGTNREFGGWSPCMRAMVAANTPKRPTSLTCGFASGFLPANGTQVHSIIYVPAD